MNVAAASRVVAGRQIAYLIPGQDPPRRRRDRARFIATEGGPQKDLAPRGLGATVAEIPPVYHPDGLCRIDAVFAADELNEMSDICQGGWTRIICQFSQDDDTRIVGTTGEDEDVGSTFPRVATPRKSGVDGWLRR